MVIVDSSVWIEALRRNGRLEVKVGLEGLLDAYKATYCSPIRLEVLGGARREERHRLSGHFSSIPCLTCEKEDWEHAISLAWQLRDKGITVPWLDVLIAAMAIHRTFRVYSIDTHFQSIADHIPLLMYNPGYGGSYQGE